MPIFATARTDNLWVYAPILTLLHSPHVASSALRARRVAWLPSGLCHRVLAGLVLIVVRHMVWFSISASIQEIEFCKQSTDPMPACREHRKKDGVGAVPDGSPEKMRLFATMTSA